MTSLCEKVGNPHLRFYRKISFWFHCFLYAHNSYIFIIAVGHTHSDLVYMYRYCHANPNVIRFLSQWLKSVISFKEGSSCTDRRNTSLIKRRRSRSYMYVWRWGHFRENPILQIQPLFILEPISLSIAFVLFDIHDLALYFQSHIYKYQRERNSEIFCWCFFFSERIAT